MTLKYHVDIKSISPKYLDYQALRLLLPMSLLDLNNDVKSIISKHLLNDKAINKILMTKPDNDFQKKNWWSERDGHELRRCMYWIQEKESLKELKIDVEFFLLISIKK